jgi:hypothetical protein
MPERRWTREVIPIDTDCGLVAVQARVLGPIAVHFGIGSHRQRISITHLGTGRRIASTIAPHIARQVAEQLAEANWDCVTGDSVPEPLKIQVRQILKRYDLLPISEPASAADRFQFPPFEPCPRSDRHHGTLFGSGRSKPASKE